jgi:hypothetical protein
MGQSLFEEIEGRDEDLLLLGAACGLVGPVQGY